MTKSITFHARKRLSVLGLLCLLGLSGCSNYDEDSLLGITANTLMKDGRANLEDKQYKRAADHFEAVLRQYPTDPLVKDATADLVYTDLKRGKPVEALSEADRYLRLYPGSENADYVLYLSGLAVIGQSGNSMQHVLGGDAAVRDTDLHKDAQKRFQRLVDQYPTSAYYTLAQDQVLRIDRLMASKLLQTAQFYASREAYVAAINRAQEMLDRYPRYVGAPAAKALIQQCRAKLSLTKDKTIRS